ncbi:MAG: pectate lyase family protein [Myxococcota bacterium]
MIKRLLASGLLMSVPFAVLGCSAANTDTAPEGHGGAIGSNSGGSSNSSGGQSGASANGGNNAAGGSTGGSNSGSGGLASAGTSSSGGNAGSSAAGGNTAGGTTGASGNTSSGGASKGGNGSGGTGAMGGSSSQGGTSTMGGASSGGASAGGNGSGGKAAGGTTASGGTGAGGKAAGGTTASGGTTSVGTTPGKGAPETKAVGYGQGTTGAGSAATVDVSSMSALQSAIDGYSGSGGLSIRYTGKFNFASISDPCAQHSLPAQIVEIKNKNDISIVGADGSAVNFGIHIASASSNIIIRNMTFGLLPGGGSSDAISVEGMSGGTPKNIWIDHNELFSSMTVCAGAGDEAFDGLIDLKKGADNVTVSYNYIHDHHKGTLNGFSDSDTAVRHITYHHNIFENVGSRTPLQRGGYSHLFANLFSGITVSGANIRMDGYALIEANFFEKAKNPVTSRDSDALGYWELRGNNIASPADFTRFSITWSASDSSPTKDATDWATTKAFPVSLGYSYTAQHPQCVKDGLHAVAGAGKGLATLTCK